MKHTANECDNITEWDRLDNLESQIARERRPTDDDTKERETRLDLDDRHDAHRTTVDDLHDAHRTTSRPIQASDARADTDRRLGEAGSGLGNRDLRRDADGNRNDDDGTDNRR